MPIMSLRQFKTHFIFFRNRPKLYFRVLKNIFYAFVLRIPRMKNLELAITYNCNQKCNMCSAVHLKKSRDVMTVKQILSTVEQAKKLGLVHVDLTGGEPLLRPFNEVEAIVRGITKNKDMVVAMATNGLLVTEDKLRRLRKAGMTQILFNIQHPDAKKHDEIVGVKGSYEKIVKNIKLAKKLGMTICINTVIGTYNFDDIVRLADKCKKWGIFCALNPAASAGRWVDEKERKLTDEWYEKKYKHFIKNPYVRADTVFNFRTLGWGCPGGIEKWYITSYGDVIQCPFVQVSYGNVLKEPVKDIFERISNFPYIKRYSDKCKHLFDNEFNIKWLKPLDDYKELPLLITEHPTIKKDQELRNKILHAEKLQ